jgi:hypothetical protein
MDGGPLACPHWRSGSWGALMRRWILSQASGPDRDTSLRQPREAGVTGRTREIVLLPLL